jgi:hypothetical protein
VTEQSCDFARPTLDVWQQLGSDTHAQQDPGAGRNAKPQLGPNSLRLQNLRSNASFCYRVRMRDRSLAWSAWSLPASFRTLASPGEQIVQQVSSRAF